MFEAIPKIEKPEFYMELAIRTAKKYSSMKKVREKKRARRLGETEIIKADTFTRTIKGHIERICTSFPSLNQLPVFYSELLDIVIGSNELKVALARIQGTAQKIDELFMDFRRSAKVSDEETTLRKKREFYGRANSILKKTKDAFQFAENARKDMKRFPSIKTKIPTVCICGYPNVGKSTLLYKLTGSMPDIAPYAFTTKNLMIGYIGKDLQLIDTPGAFSEDLKKMNWLEKQSYLAIKYLSKNIVFVFDITETCGFGIKEQEEFFDRLERKFRAKKFVIYLSKADYGTGNKEDILKKYEGKKIFDNAEELKVFLLKEMAEIS